ncbi:hypothetical protein [Rhizobium grahamii]|uniref:Uncharacterized protein n=1 Tax=Rhizobium grahamii CCGE 502 TaxID=990285 RepID=S3HIS9_9HYPH|nr:hypothetical protein [Rhizobium grahamii]EPE98644.1 hypothetical protein RGCCGE502_09465 [Rhizobium grahamii CCGE 502]
MTTHAPIKHSDRTALPRGLLPRRRRFVNPDYEMTYQIGQPVTLKCTDEAAYVVGRIQIVGCLDEYLIQIVGADCDALRVLEHQIS